MLVVPLKGDVVSTDDGRYFTVLEYTNYKPDPAVYIDVPAKQHNLLYFTDIHKINGIKVEYNKATKVFDAFGVVKRKFNIPQPKDTAMILDPHGQEDSTPQEIEIKTIRLHSRSLGLSRGLCILDADGNAYRLRDIQEIKRSYGYEAFDRKKFLKYYSDYSGS